MPKKARDIGLFLILLGIVSYIGTGMISITALIPSFFGLILGGLGVLAMMNERMRKHAMHGALLIALVGILGSIDGFITLFKAMGNFTDLPLSAVAKALMSLACLYFMIMGIKSFRDARRSVG